MWRAELQELREEFRLIQFRLMHSNAGDFAETPWFGVPLILVYRVLVALYCIVWIILSGFIHGIIMKNGLSTLQTGVSCSSHLTSFFQAY